MAMAGVASRTPKNFWDTSCYGQIIPPPRSPGTESTPGWVGLATGRKKIRSYLRGQQARHGSDCMFLAANTGRERRLLLEQILPLPTKTNRTERISRPRHANPAEKGGRGEGQRGARRAAALREGGRDGGGLYGGGGPMVS